MKKPQSDTALTAWLRKRVERWQRLGELAKVQRDRQDEKVEDVRELAQGFRALARDVSLARGVMPDSRLTHHLEALFLGLHEVIFRAPGSLGQELKKLFTVEIPRIMWILRGSLAATGSLFILGGAVGWWLVATYPELAALFASEQMIQKVQRGELWTDGLLNVFPPSILSLQIMTNNIVVALFAFALGVFYGLGTLYIIGLNGLLLGGVFAFTAEYSLHGKLFSFVVAHGIVELTVICIAGAAGVHLGEALARPGARTRTEAFREAVRLGGRLMVVCALFLVGAGFIEGYISPDPSYPLSTRITVGVTYACVLWLVLSGRLWQLKPQADPF